jgi:hypothetical protein
MNQDAEPEAEGQVTTATDLSGDPS